MNILQKISFTMVFFAIGMLATGWWYNNFRIVTVQEERLQEKISSFMAKGARFTAQDGHALCEHVRALEERSYGFRDAGKTPLNCEYGQRK